MQQSCTTNSSINFLSKFNFVKQAEDVTIEVLITVSC